MPGCNENPISSKKANLDMHRQRLKVCRIGGDGKLTVHTLKIWPEFYQAVVHPDLKQRKRVEIRKNDRDYRVGDELLLQEYNPISNVYTRQEARVLVTHILSGEPWLPEGNVALSIMLLKHKKYGR
jgi:ribosomal protein S17